jgi:hypothetical protein
MFVELSLHVYMYSIDPDQWFSHLLLNQQGTSICLICQQMQNHRSTLGMEGKK